MGKLMKSDDTLMKDGRKIRRSSFCSHSVGRGEKDDLLRINQNTVKFCLKMVRKYLKKVFEDLFLLE